VDISGLRQVVLSPIFPFDLLNYHFVLAFPEGSAAQGRIRIGPYEASYTINAGRPHLDRFVVAGIPVRTGGRCGALIHEPGTLKVTLLGDTEIEIGRLEFLYQPADPLSDDVRRAIESNPTRWKVIAAQFSCPECKDGITPYVAIRRNPGIPDFKKSPRPTWYTELPDKFVCSCGKASVQLRFLRESMHYLLQALNPFLPDGSMATAGSSVSPTEVNQVLTTFAGVLDSAPLEEDVQTFIESNPMLLAPFAARNLFFKPPILTKFRADFGIVTSREELLLIEIERPSLRLFNKDGTQTAELTQALHQPECWDNAITENRAAVLSCIKNCPAEIATISYLVIAGRSEPCEPEVLRKFLRSRSARFQFMTYDHLMQNVRDAIRSTLT